VIGFSRNAHRPELGRLDRGVDRAVAAHHDHRHRQLRRRTPFLEQRDAVDIRHPDVEQDEIGADSLAQARAWAAFSASSTV
jgi:hypothetical protein